MVKHEKIVQTRQELNKGKLVVNYLAKFQIRSQSQSCFKTNSKIQPLLGVLYRKENNGIQFSEVEPKSYWENM